MTKLREWIFETSKFASVVLTYWIVSTVTTKLNWKPDFAEGKLLEMFLEAVVASTIAFIFWGFVVGRPVVELHWRVSESYQPENGRPTLTPNQAVNVQIHVNGESWTSKLIRRYTRGRKFELELDFEPHGSHLVVVQTRQNAILSVNPTRTGVVFTDFDTGVGIRGVAEIQILRDGQFTISNPLNIKVIQRWSPSVHKFCPKLLKVKPGVDGFNLGRS